MVCYLSDMATGRKEVEVGLFRSLSCLGTGRKGLAGLIFFKSPGSLKP